MTDQPIVVSFDEDGLRLDTSEDAEVICERLVDKQVEVLILQGNTFGIEAAERVGLELANQSALKEAHFKDLFTSRGREEVPEALRHLLQGINQSGAQLVLLDLSDNAIGPIGAPSVIEFLQSPACETLEKLYVNNCGWGPEGSTSLATCMPRLNKLREFVCGRSRLENKGATNMSRALSDLTNLEVLKLNQNGINVDGIEKLVDVLVANVDTIREIDLSDNTIKSQGSCALALALSRATNLKIIRLDDALLENEGFVYICEALSRSPSLPHLEKASFEGNELSGPKIVDLIDVTFTKCNKNFNLDLLENDFSPTELKRLESLSEKFKIDVDDIENETSESDDSSGSSEESDTDVEDEQKLNDDNKCKREEGEIASESDASNGYVDLGNSYDEVREVSQDFIAAIGKQPYDDQSVNSAFIQLISYGAQKPQSDTSSYQAVQVLCEELGLIKMEQTRKKKPLARSAIAYLGNRSNELPGPFRDFFEVVVNKE